MPLKVRLQVTKAPETPQQVADDTVAVTVAPRQNAPELSVRVISSETDGVKPVVADSPDQPGGRLAEALQRSKRSGVGVSTWVLGTLAVSLMVLGVTVTASTTTPMTVGSLFPAKVGAPAAAPKTPSVIRTDPESTWVPTLSLGELELTPQDEALLKTAEVALRDHCMAKTAEPPAGHQFAWTARHVMLARQRDVADRFGVFGEPYALHHAEATTAFYRASIEWFNTGIHVPVDNSEQVTKYFQDYQGQREESDQTLSDGTALLLASQGCRRDVRTQLYGDFAASEKQAEMAWSAREALLVPVTSDPEYKTVRAEWQKCMKKTGSYPAATMQAVGQIRPDWLLKLNQDQQRDVLQTSLTCQVKVNAPSVVQGIIDRRVSENAELAGYVKQWNQTQRDALPNARKALGQ